MISTDVMFGTLNSRTDLGLVFTHKEIGTPDLHTEYVEVPGRTPVDLSELIIGYPQYQMREIVVEFEYTGVSQADERTLVFAKLHGRKMNVRFLDDPTWYYVGRCKVEYEVNASTLHFTVTITADPYKKILSETPQTFSAAGTITNNYEFYSRPLIRVNGTGSGTLTIGNQTITITGLDGYMYIDSELMDCYKGLTNCNNLVTLSEFPKLFPGANNISFTGNISSVVITGRWRTL